MFVKNFYMKLAVDLTATTQNNGPYPKAPNGNASYYIGYSAYGAKLDFSCSDSSSNGVHFGDGNTPVTFDDYKLSGNRIKGLTVSSTPKLDHTDDDMASYTVVYTITNGKSEAVTIKEVAMFVSAQQGTNSSYAFSLMVDRTVLDSPVTIEPGGVGQVTYKVEFNYPA